MTQNDNNRKKNKTWSEENWFGSRFIIYEPCSLEQVILPAALVFFCCVTNYHKFCGLKRLPTAEPTILQVGSLDGLNWILCLIEAKIKVLAV